MSTLVDFRAGWTNTGEQQDITRKNGIYQNFRDRHTDVVTRAQKRSDKKATFIWISILYGTYRIYIHNIASY